MVPTPNVSRLTVCLFVISLFFSCSKDSDLLDDYSVTDVPEVLDSRKFVKDDTFSIEGNSSIILDVLSNDDFPDIEKVRIVEISNPSLGIVEIQDDKTIVYTPVNNENPPNTDSDQDESQNNEGDTTNNDSSSDEGTTGDSDTTGNTGNGSGESTEGSNDSGQSNDGEENSEGNNSDESPESDTFNYTAETENEDGTTTTEEGTVTVEYTDEETEEEEETEQEDTAGYDPGPIPEQVLYWKQRFDDGWSYYESEINSLTNSRNRDQEYYYLGYYVDGLTSLWQATGDNRYLDTVLGIVNKTMDDAVSMGGYLGWPSASGQQVSLWDSFYWRFVATLTRIMHQSPNLRSEQKYQNAYERLLNFSERNIWDRYAGNPKDNMYRINTHMASHWARIGMELYLITGNSKYKKVFDEISFGPNPYRPSNLRQQLKFNPNVPTAYVWNMNWDDTYIQDTSHAGAIVSFWVAAEENDMYWNRSDINALVSTFNDVICTGELTGAREYVDGTGKLNPAQTYLNEWIALGRYNREIQDKVYDHYSSRNNLGYVGLQPAGIAALNEKILTDGRPAYPENW